jgi:hypothetical protein
VAADADAAAAVVAAAAAFGNRSLATLGSDADAILIPNRQGGNIQISTTTKDFGLGKYNLSIYINMPRYIYIYRDIYIVHYSVTLHSRKKHLASKNQQMIH